MSVLLSFWFDDANDLPKVWNTRKLFFPKYDVRPSVTRRDALERSYAILICNKETLLYEKCCVWKYYAQHCKLLVVSTMCKK